MIIHTARDDEVSAISSASVSMRSISSSAGHSNDNTSSSPSVVSTSVSSS